MTRSECPASISLRRAASSFAMSSKWSPVVGSSRMYISRSPPSDARCAAILIRCASPPESVVAGWPSRRYPRPISSST